MYLGRANSVTMAFTAAARQCPGALVLHVLPRVSWDHHQASRGCKTTFLDFFASNIVDPNKGDEDGCREWGAAGAGQGKVSGGGEVCNRGRRVRLRAAAGRRESGASTLKRLAWTGDGYSAEELELLPEAAGNLPLPRSPQERWSWTWAAAVGSICCSRRGGSLPVARPMGWT